MFAYDFADIYSTTDLLGLKEKVVEFYNKNNNKIAIKIGYELISVCGTRELPVWGE